jgi:undecaprenyl-diphosphatase
MIGPVLFDQSILSVLTSPALSALHPLFFIITEIGSPLALFIYSSIAFAIGNKDIKKIAVILIIAFLMGTLVTEDLKELVHRPRPYEGIAPVYLFSNTNSFPSGHAVAAFLAATILLGYLGWKPGLAGYVAATLIGMSRIVLNVHYPTDVLGGAIIGIILGGLVIFAAYRMGISKNSGFTYRVNVHNAHDSNKKSLISINYYYMLIAALLWLTLVLYDLNHMSLSLAALALALILIALAMSSFITTQLPLLIAITITMIGLLAAFSTLMIGGYIVSLALIAIIYITILLVSAMMKPKSSIKI